MSDYLYCPEFSFLARCWWQLSDQLLNPEQWQSSVAQRAPVWLHYGDAAIHNDNWETYLRTERAGRETLNPVTINVTRSGHVYAELFWFGAYIKGSDADGPRLFYEIRPYERDWKPLNRVLRNNPSMFSGYVAAQDQQVHEAGRRLLPASAQLWTLSGIDYKAMQRGARLCNVLLFSPTGARVKRYEKSGAWLINTVSGEPGYLSLEVLDMAHEARSVAWGTGLETTGSRYRFSPERSFIARCWWRPSTDSGRGYGDETGGLVSARFDDGRGWHLRATLSVGREDELSEHWLEGEARQASDRFWFAAYVEGGNVFYELWPLDQQGRRLGFTVRTERGWRLSAAQRWTGERALPDFLWRLRGAEVGVIEQGAKLEGLQLEHASGLQVALNDARGRRYLDTMSTANGSLTLEVLESAARF